MTIFNQHISHWIKGIIYFFPFQLLLAHFKRNHILLFFWVIAFGLVTEVLASKYGIPQLLLFPEYLDQVNFLSHILLGLSCGSFIIAFNMTSYIINGFRFPFIATLSKPFYKYCINNFIIPLAFYVVYINHLIQYQMNSELLSSMAVFKNVSGFLLGNFLFLFISIFYFVSTNKSIFKILRITGKKPSIKIRPIQELIEPDLKWYQRLRQNSEWRIETYLTGRLQIRRARSSKHYKRVTLKKVFQQNHLNASLFGLGAILSIFILGWFMDYKVFEIPAGASIFVLLSMILMFSGALHNWLKGWSIAGFIIIFIVLNVFSQFYNLRIESQAHGLDYNTKANYSNSSLDLLALQDSASTSLYNEVLRLNRLQERVGKDKKMVLINASGGGLRASMWTFQILQRLDSLSHGELMKHTALISGASGGMIGSAYFRELYLRKYMLDEEFQINEKHTQNAGKDILNQLAFSWVVNDFFIRFRKTDYEGRKYSIDRGYYFEEKLIENFDGILDVPLKRYSLYVHQGQIPDMWLAPTIENDGRRLLIANSDTRFMHHEINDKSTHHLVDYNALFKEQDSENIKFTTALRMSATFPYVLPSVSLPSHPPIEVMDAGVRDNYGTTLSLKYLNALSSYIDTNIQEIAVIRIVDNQNEIKVKTNPYSTLLNSVFSPLGSVYLNLFNYQKMAQDEAYALLDENIRYKVVFYDFFLNFNTNNQIPLSWHLSAQDKNQIIEASRNEQINDEMQRLISFINEN